jgi:hypothetical protein
MNAAERIQRANNINDKRSTRLMTIEAVALAMLSKYGACGSECRDDHQAALWYWIHNEVQAAIEALDELSVLVRGEVVDDATT